VLFEFGRLVVRLRSHADLSICHDCLCGLNGQRAGQLELISDTWLVRGFDPIFKVADVTHSVAWFERAGFKVSFYDDTYAFAHRDRDLTIQNLAQTQGDEVAGQGVFYIHCQGADRPPDDLRQAGNEVDGLRNEDYGKREGSITDPDGNVTRFGSSIP
jgi:hypothetical protein